MHDLLDLDRYPVDRFDSPRCRELIGRCKADLATHGMFNLEGPVRPEALARSVAGVDPLLETASHRRARAHNIYFRDHVPGLPEDHLALRKVETVNYTLCGDQLMGSVIERIYEWKPLVDFLAAVMGKDRLHLMSDPLARLNVLAY